MQQGWGRETDTWLKWDFLRRASSQVSKWLEIGGQNGLLSMVVQRDLEPYRTACPLTQTPYVVGSGNLPPTSACLLQKRFTSTMIKVSKTWSVGGKQAGARVRHFWSPHGAEIQ